MNAPGVWLIALASRLLPSRTVERVIEPLVADMRLECAEAGDDKWRRRRVLMTGYWGGVKAIGLCACGEAARYALAWSIEERIALQRALLVGTIAVAIALALLLSSNVPLAIRPGLNTHRLSMLLVPGYLFLALPAGLAVGILAALRGRRASARLYGACLVAGIVCSISMLLNAGWVTPRSNQAFRTTMYGQSLEPGYQEMTFPELLARERDAQVRGYVDGARLARHVLNRRVYWSCAGLLIALSAMAASATLARLRRT